MTRSTTKLHLLYILVKHLTLEIAITGEKKNNYSNNSYICTAKDMDEIKPAPTHTSQNCFKMNLKQQECDLPSITPS